MLYFVFLGAYISNMKILWKFGLFSGKKSLKMHVENLLQSMLYIRSISASFLSLKWMQNDPKTKLIKWKNTNGTIFTNTKPAKTFDCCASCDKAVCEEQFCKDCAKFSILSLLYIEWNLVFLYDNCALKLISCFFYKIGCMNHGKILLLFRSLNNSIFWSCRQWAFNFFKGLISLRSKTLQWIYLL